MIEFDGNVSIEDVVAVARYNERAVVARSIFDSVAQAHQAALEMALHIPTYGRNTGVGANRSVTVADDDKEHGLRLLRSHAVDAGEALPPVVVRAMLAVRLAQLSIAGSGIRPDILDAVSRMLEIDALPVVLEFGSVGTADLAALAAVALSLMGERSTTTPINSMEPWGADSALPFMSSSALTLGRTCLVIEDLRQLIQTSLIVFSLSFVGLRGNRSPFSEVAALAGGTSAMKEVCQKLREQLGEAGETARIQDPYALRAFPITLSPVFDALNQLDDLVTTLINTAQENPLFVDGQVVHHAGFHQAALTLKADALALALAAQTPISLSRIRLMSEPDFTGTRAFLASETRGSSGIMMVEYVAGAALGELYACAQPSSLTTVVLSRGAEEDASFAPVAVGQLERAVGAVQTLLGCELLIATRMLRQQCVERAELPSNLLQRAWDVVSVLPSDETDRDLRPDLELAQRLLPELARL